jgi:hypothetical protein
MACRTSLEVEHLLAQFRMNQQDAPLVTALHFTGQRLAQQRRGHERDDR